MASNERREKFVLRTLIDFRIIGREEPLFGDYWNPNHITFLEAYRVCRWKRLKRRSERATSPVREQNLLPGSVSSISWEQTICLETLCSGMENAPGTLGYEE